MTEQRFFKVNVRRRGERGVFRPEIFELTVAMTGSYHDLCADALGQIENQGYETMGVTAHSRQRSCL